MSHRKRKFLILYNNNDNNMFYSITFLSITDNTLYLYTLNGLNKLILPNTRVCMSDVIIMITLFILFGDTRGSTQSARNV